MNANTKVKLAVLLDDGDKLEYEGHVQASGLEQAKAEAESRFRGALAKLNGKSGALPIGKIKIETY